MSERPIVGDQICAPLKSLRPLLPVIRHHHEKMDGSGYPDGLREEAIPLQGRILQIADIYDALTTDRPYREALAHNEALSILFAEAENGCLDSIVVAQFAQIFKGREYFPIRGRTMLAFTAPSVSRTSPAVSAWLSTSSYAHNGPCLAWEQRNAAAKVV